MKLPKNSRRLLSIILLSIVHLRSINCQKLFVDAGLRDPKVLNVSFSPSSPDVGSIVEIIGIPAEITTEVSTELKKNLEEDLNNSSEASGEDDYSDEDESPSDIGEDFSDEQEIGLLKKASNETDKDNAIIATEAQESKTSAVVISSPTDLKASATGYGGGGGSGGYGGSGGTG
jgi:hypothetical protein